MLRQHVLVELKQFVQAMSTKNIEALTSNGILRISLHLLEDLPAARDIVFEYFTFIADLAVQKYVTSNNFDMQQQRILPADVEKANEENSIEDMFPIIQDALENLILKGPQAWCPLITNWVIELIGNLTNKYNNRQMPIMGACNYWLHCGTMHSLMTVISISLRKLTIAEAESCVETMLVTFQRYPSFDWVVARLGGCYPIMTFSQLLQLSLKRFKYNFDAVPPRFDLELGIIEYMAFAHEQELKATFRDLLREGFEPKNNSDVGIIPFLLYLSKFSDLILENLVNVFLGMYDDDLRAKIVQKSSLWLNNACFSEMQPKLKEILLRLKSNGSKLLLTIAKIAEQYNWCQELLESCIQELERLTLSIHSCPLMGELCTEESKCLLWKSCLTMNICEQQTAVRLLLLVSVQRYHNYYQTVSELLRQSYAENPNGVGALLRILGGLSGVVMVPDVKPGLQMVLEDIQMQQQFQRIDSNEEAINTFKNLNTITKMLRKQTFPYIELQQIVTPLTDCFSKILQIFDVVVTKLVLHMDRDAEKKAKEAWENRRNNNHTSCGFNYMVPNKKAKLEGENIEKMETDDESVGGGANDNDELTLGLFVNSEEVDNHEERLILAHSIVDLLNNIEVGSKVHVMRTSEILKLAVLSVKYFFVCLGEPDRLKRRVTVHRALSLLQRQCSVRKMSRSTCLRELIEGSLFYYGYHFGQFDEPQMDELGIPEHEMVSIQNLRHSMGPNSNRTVLHAGVIGRGLRPEGANGGVRCDAEMQRLLLKALDACCADGDKQNNTEGYSMISLLLVELVSTDVMYNGLPFPDEEFTKVTMERDLLIRRAFNNSPVLWAFLGFIAAHRPALCFSSVLLRALCATCLHQWRAKNVNKLQPIDPNEELMQTTKKLLGLLAVGQLLPPPLSNLHMIIEYFEPQEIALILKECVWNYLKDHVPSPALFVADANGVHWRNPIVSKIPPHYVDTLRNIMQKKLTKLGPHYHQMFIMREIFEVPAEAAGATEAEK